MSEQRPLLLLDVDGVLNPCPFVPQHVAYGWRFEPTLRAEQFQMNLSVEMGAALMALPIDIEWLTSWCADGDTANPNIGRALGWPTLPIHEDVATPTMYGGIYAGTWWKMDAVKRVMAKEPGRRIVWIDDDLKGFTGREVATGFLPNILAISPESDVGLTRAHLDAIKEWLTNV